MWGRKSSKSFFIHAQMIKKGGERSIKLSLPVRVICDLLLVLKRREKCSEAFFSTPGAKPSGINIAGTSGHGKKVQKGRLRFMIEMNRCEPERF
jgi:hypothetical protein